MARRRTTARKNVTKKEWSLVDVYYAYQLGEELATSVRSFGLTWEGICSRGITNYYGIVRLISILPEHWKDWAEAIAQHYIWRKLPAYDLDGDMRGFYNHVLGSAISDPSEPPPLDTVEAPQGPVKLSPWVFLKREQGVDREARELPQVRKPILAHKAPNASEGERNEEDTEQGPKAEDMGNKNGYDDHGRDMGNEDEYDDYGRDMRDEEEVYDDYGNMRYEGEYDDFGNMGYEEENDDHGRNMRNEEEGDEEEEVDKEVDEEVDEEVEREEMPTEMKEEQQTNE